MSNFSSISFPCFIPMSSTISSFINPSLDKAETITGKFFENHNAVDEDLEEELALD